MPRDVDDDILAKLAESNLRDKLGVRSPSDIDALVDLGRITEDEARTLKRLNQKGILRALAKGETVAKGAARAKDTIDVAKAASSVKSIEDHTKRTARAASKASGIGRVVDATEAELEESLDDAVRGSSRRTTKASARLEESLDDAVRGSSRRTTKASARGPNAIARALGSAGAATTSAKAGSAAGTAASVLPKVGKLAKLMRFGGTALGAIAVADLAYQLLSAGQDENMERRLSDRFQQNAGSEFEAEHAYEEEVNRFLNRRDSAARRVNDLGEAAAASRMSELDQIVNGRQEALAQIAYREPPSLAEVLMRAGVRL